MEKKYVHYVKVSINNADGVECDWYNVYVRNEAEARAKVSKFLHDNTTYADYCEIKEVSRQKPKFFTRIDNDNDNVYWALVSFLDDKEKEWYQLTANNENEAREKVKKWLNTNACYIEEVIKDMPRFYYSI